MKVSPPFTPREVAAGGISVGELFETKDGAVYLRIMRDDVVLNLSEDNVLCVALDGRSGLCTHIKKSDQVHPLNHEPIKWSYR